MLGAFNGFTVILFEEAEPFEESNGWAERNSYL